MFPLGAKHFRLIADHPLSDPHQATPTLEECQSIYQQRSHIRARFHDLVWSSYFHINSRMVSSLRAGRVFLGGDAAHIHSPAGGQGMNTGIQDMINLAWKLAFVKKGWGAAGLLDTYQEDRLPVMRGVLKTTEMMTEMIGSESHVFRALFNHLTPFIVGTDFVQEKGTQRMSELAVNYRDSPLSEDHGPHHGIRAGDRVPDLHVQLVNSSRAEHDSHKGAPIPLFELLDASRFTLLVVADPSRGDEFTRVEEAWRESVSSAGENSTQFIHVCQPQGGTESSFEKTFGNTSNLRGRSLYLVRPDATLPFEAKRQTWIY